jgi:hypothetical protein
MAMVRILMTNQRKFATRNGANESWRAGGRVPPRASETGVCPALLPSPVPALRRSDIAP